MKKIFAVILCLVCSASSWAIDKRQEDFSSVQSEQRYNALIAELRCVVCQNQSLADSNAELAQDLRNEVHELIESGKSDAQVKDFLVQRYGDFVLYRPPLKPRTYLLWLGPLIMLLIAIPLLFLFVRRQANQQDTGLSPEDREKVRQALAKKDKKENM